MSINSGINSLLESPEPEVNVPKADDQSLAQTNFLNIPTDHSAKLDSGQTIRSIEFVLPVGTYEAYRKSDGSLMIEIPTGDEDLRETLYATVGNNENGAKVINTTIERHQFMHDKEGEQEFPGKKMGEFTPVQRMWITLGNRYLRSKLPEDKTYDYIDIMKSGVTRLKELILTAQQNGGVSGISVKNKALHDPTLHASDLFDPNKKSYGEDEIPLDPKEREKIVRERENQLNEMSSILQSFV